MEPKNENKGRKKKLIILISALVLVIIGMVVAIILVVSKPAEPEIDPRSFEEIFWDSETAEEAISEFQKKIDATADPEQKAKLYIERSKFLFEIFYNDENMKEIIINDLVIADQLLETPETAQQLYTKYSYYNETDKSSEYENIYYTRIKELSNE